jgi:DNA primase
MDLIRRKGLPVYMAYDGDEAGDSATRDTTEHLNGRVPLFQLAIPRGMDPDDLTKGQALDVIERKKLVL